MHPLVKAGLLATVASNLSACAGAGGGINSTPGPAVQATNSTSTTPPPASPPPKTADQVETEKSSAVVASKASYAHDLGFTGRGVTIAFIDTGIDASSPEFAGRISSASTTIQTQYATCGTCASATTNYDLADHVGHGTNVAAVAAGGRNGSYMYGVAYGATIMAVKITGANLDTFVDGIPQESQALNVVSIAPAIRYAAQNGAFVINMSANGTASGAIADAMRSSMDYVHAQNLLLVESVSNDPINSSGAGSITAALVGLDGSNRNNFLYGISLYSDLTPRAGSGTPGLLADRTLSVVSNGILVTGPGGEAAVVVGNSFAAPAIAGAAALLKQYWPQLGGAEISKVLLDTATDMGDPGVDQIYGVGLMNIEAAFKAQLPTISTSAVKPSGVGQTSLVVSPAFGGASGSATFSAAAGQAVAIDRYGRDYKVTMGMLAHGAEAKGISLVSLLPENAAGFPNAVSDGMSRTDGYAAAPQAHAFGFRVSPRTAVTGTVNSSVDTNDLMTGSMLRSSGIATVGTRVNLLNGGTRISIANARSAFGRRYSSTQSVAVEATDGLTFSLATNKEVGAALGMTGSGSFNIDGAKSLFATVGWNGNLAGFGLSAEGLLGSTNITTSNSLISFNSSILSSGFRFAARHHLLGGRAVVGLTSPLKVERANIRYEAPTAYDLASRSTTDSVSNINLAPSSREMDLEAGWSHNVGSSTFSFGSALGLNTGNVRGQSSAAAWLRFNTRL